MMAVFSKETLLTDTSTVLIASVRELTLALSLRTLDIDWDEPDDLSRADRWMKILSSYGRNIEKCLAMTQKQDIDDSPATQRAEIERLKNEIQQRLDRYAERVGTEELARRVRDRGFDPDALRLELLGETKST